MSAHVKRGFTLVELLVVIGIIALLISILLPSLNRARQSAQSLVCLSNLRQIGTAMHLYANDNKDIVIPFKIMRQQNSPGNWNEWGNYYTWFHLLHGGGYISANGQTKITQTQADTVVTGFQTGVLRCPNDANYNRGTFIGFSYTPQSFEDGLGAVFWRLWDARGTDFIETSYGMNSYGQGHKYGVDHLQRAWNLPGISFTETDDPAYKNKVHKMGTVRNSTQLMFIYDGVGPHNNHPYWLNARHMDRTRTNVLFLDGHAESFQTKGGALPYHKDQYWSANEARNKVSGVQVFVNQDNLNW